MSLFSRPLSTRDKHVTVRTILEAHLDEEEPGPETKARLEIAIETMQRVLEFTDKMGDEGARNELREVLRKRLDEDWKELDNEAKESEWGPGFVDLKRRYDFLQRHIWKCACAWIPVYQRAGFREHCAELYNDIEERKILEQLPDDGDNIMVLLGSEYTNMYSQRVGTREDPLDRAQLLLLAQMDEYDQYYAMDLELPPHQEKMLQDHERELKRALVQDRVMSVDELLQMNHEDFEKQLAHMARPPAANEKWKTSLLAEGRNMEEIVEMGKTNEEGEEACSDSDDSVSWHEDIHTEHEYVSDEDDKDGAGADENDNTPLKKRRLKDFRLRSLYGSRLDIDGKKTP